MNSDQLFDYNESFTFGKSTVTQHGLFSPLRKGSIHIITCSSCTCASSFFRTLSFPSQFSQGFSSFTSTVLGLATVRLSPWRWVQEKYQLQGVDPWSHLICTPPRRASPPGSPQFLVTGAYGPQPQTLIRTPVHGGYPRYHLILSPPRRTSLLVPLPLDLSASLPPEFCPLLFVCVLCGTQHSTFTQNHCQLEEFINSKLLKL